MTSLYSTGARPFGLKLGQKVRTSTGWYYGFACCSDLLMAVDIGLVVVTYRPCGAQAVIADKTGLLWSSKLGLTE